MNTTNDEAGEEEEEEEEEDLSVEARCLPPDVVDFLDAAVAEEPRLCTLVPFGGFCCGCCC